jgi:ubiquinone/menaquinone biosynthesis C-methylase UbiE
VSEVLRVLRPGGRALVIEPAPRGGSFGALTTILSRQTFDPKYPGPLRTLQDESFAAVRELAERDGVLYVEGIKKA